MRKNADNFVKIVQLSPPPMGKFLDADVDVVK